MPLRVVTRVDPQLPSTSTAPQRRLLENRQTFEEFFQINAPPTLWEVCSARQRGKSLKNEFQTEVRALRGLNFKVFLQPHRSYLDDLTKLCGTTFEDLCQALRFFSFYKKRPVLNTNRSDADEFFKLVASCIIYEKDNWIALFDKNTLVDTTAMNILQTLRVRSPKGNSSDEKQGLTGSSNLTCTFLLNDQISKKKTSSQKRSFNPLEDENLRSIHQWNHVGCHDTKFNGPFEKYLYAVTRNNNAIRTKKVGMSDVEYYGDEEDLPSTQISFKLDNVMQIINFDFPKIENDGYFCKDRPDFAWYLFENYQKAHNECTAAFSEIRSPYANPVKAGFVSDSLSAEECFKFHKIGRHIHGFFDVWKEKERGWKNESGKWVSRRYLVDIYNQIMFPLYVEWPYWPATLKWAFDKYSLYGLRLMSLVKRHPQELKNAGNMLFSRYSSHINEPVKCDLTTTKGRNHYLSTVQIENNRAVDKFLNSSAYNINEEDGRKKKRKPRKSDELPLSTPPQKVQRTPRKASEPSPFGSTQNHTLVQKENMNKIMLTPPKATIGPQSVTITLRKTPNSASKRPMPENEIVFSRASVPPPTKKMSITTDSWDDHVHNSMDEEHVDEEKDSDEHDDSEGRQNVWVPQDRGFEVAPEQYAREIIEHYISGSRELKSHPPLLISPKTQKGRKPSHKHEQTSSLIEQNVLMPTTSIAPLQSISPALSTLPSVSAHSPVNGNIVVPSGKAVVRQTARVMYSMKPQAAPSVQKPRFPVKTLSQPAVSSSQLNGTNASGALTSSSPPLTTATSTRNVHNYSSQQKHPYFPTGMRPKAASAKNGTESTTLTSTIHPLLQRNAHNSNNLNRNPAHKCGSGNPSTPSNMFVPPERRPGEVFQTPASRAIANQKHMMMSTEVCQRVIPYNVQMMYKHRQWHQPFRSASSPVAIQNTTVVPFVQRTISSGPLLEVHRPRSFSNVIQSNINFPITAPIVTSPTSSNANERNIGNPKSRQYVPWVANSRAVVAAAMATMEETAEKISSGPLLLSPTCSALASPPVPIPAMVEPTIVPIAVASSTTLANGDVIDPSQLTLRSITSHIRKQHGIMTPEQLGDAIRTESQRFQGEANGDEGPTVKSFLMNLKN